MPFAPWTSALFGIALGLANAVASYVLYRVGYERSSKAFLWIVFGGMVARFVTATVVVGLVLLYLPVDRLAFVGGFLVAFAVGTAAEILLIQRRAARARPQP